MQSNYNIGINSYCGDTPAKLKIVYDAIISIMQMTTMKK